MIIEFAILSLILGIVRRGSLRNLSSIPLKHLYLFAFPFVAFVAMYIVALFGHFSFRGYAGLLNIVNYILLLVALGANLHIQDLRIIWGGTFLNFLVCAANGGYMPISEKAAKIAGLANIINPSREGEFVRHVLLTADSKLKWLADVIPLPGFGPHTPEVASIGDVVITIGIFMLIQRYMCIRKSSLEKKKPH